MNKPWTLEASGEYFSRQAGTENELQAPYSISDHNSDGDVEGYVVLKLSCVLLHAWTVLAYLTALIEVSLPMFGQLPSIRRCMISGE